MRYSGPPCSASYSAHRQLRLQQIDLDAVLLRDPIAQVERFLKLVAGFQIEHVRFRRDLRQHRQDDAALRPKGRGHRQVRGVTLDAPGDDLLRRGRFQPLAGGCQARPSSSGVGSSRRKPAAGFGRPACRCRGVSTTVESNMTSFKWLTAVADGRGCDARQVIKSARNCGHLRQSYLT